MGTELYFDVVHSVDPVDAVYSRLCEDEGYEHGHSYSGTIVESSGYRQMSRTVYPVKLVSEAVYADPDGDTVILPNGTRASMYKGGPALAVPIGPDEDNLTTTRQSVTVDGPTYTAIIDNYKTERLRDLVTVKAGHTLVSVTLSPSKEDHTVTSKVDAVRTSGKAVTTYQHSGSPNTSYPTIAAARAAAVAYLDRPTSQWGAPRGTTAISITGKVARPDHVPLVTVTKRVTKAVLAVDVTTMPTNRKIQQTGWAFFGLAPC